MAGTPDSPSASTSANDITYLTRVKAYQAREWVAFIQELPRETGWKLANRLLERV